MDLLSIKEEVMRFTMSNAALGDSSSKHELYNIVLACCETCRNQQKLTEAVPVSRFPQDPKSPTSSNARAQRRQSLTGVLPIESSRRSSLGGNVT